jgi:hypothetical protein
MLNAYEDLIGTPRYPLGHSGLKRVFTNPSTRIEDEGLAALIRKVHASRPFQFGQCYSNVERAVANAKGNGWKNVLPFAGWLMIKDQEPIHHAWFVLTVGGESKPIDLSSFTVPAPELKALDEALAKESAERLRDAKKKTEGLPAAEANQIVKQAWLDWQIECRQRSSAVFRPYETGDIVSCRVWGDVPVGHVYIGCPCLPNEARNIFLRWHPRYGKQSNHAGAAEPTVMQLVEQGRVADARAKLSKETE